MSSSSPAGSPGSRSGTLCGGGSRAVASRRARSSRTTSEIEIRNGSGSGTTAAYAGSQGRKYIQIDGRFLTTPIRTICAESEILRAGRSTSWSPPEGYRVAHDGGTTGECQRRAGPEHGVGARVRNRRDDELAV